MVPGVGVEPTLLSEPDFESGASANSATRARLKETKKGCEWRKGKPEMRGWGRQSLSLHLRPGGGSLRLTACLIQ
jgi:hypothetical protein